MTAMAIVGCRASCIWSRASGREGCASCVGGSAACFGGQRGVAMANDLRVLREGVMDLRERGKKRSVTLPAPSKTRACCKIISSYRQYGMSRWVQVGFAGPILETAEEEGCFLKTLLACSCVCLALHSYICSCRY